MGHRLNVKCKSIKTLNKNIEHLCYIQLGKQVLNTIEAQFIKAKNKIDLIKIKNFFPPEDTVKRIWQAIGWKKNRYKSHI